MATVMIMAMATDVRKRSLANVKASAVTSSWRGVKLARAAIISLAVLVVAATAISHALANVARDRSPGMALRFVPEHSAALAAKADDALRLDRPDEARRLARKAIDSTALSSDAYQVIALIEANNSRQGRAERLFRYTSRLSRREVPTQMWLFQQGLLSGDIQSALRHVDAAMRVSERSRPTLYLLLASALAADGLVLPMKALFEQDPVWLPGFLNYSINEGVSLRNLARVVVNLPQESIARTNSMQAALVRGLADAGEFSEARAFMHAVAPYDTGAAIRDGNFVRNGPYAPFDWSYTKGTELGASPLGGQQSGLRYYANTGSGGRVARQLIALSPGAYVLRSDGRRLSPVSDGEAAWTITCAADSSFALVQLPMNKDAGEGNRDTFVVPETGCEEQWLDLNLAASFAPGGLEGIIEAVDVVPISAADPPG